MASTRPQGTQVVGTDAAPIALGAAGGATDVWTWTHNMGQRAIRVVCHTATNRALIPDASVTVTQPSVNQMVLTNTTMGALNAILFVTWEDLSQSVIAPLAATVGVSS